MTNEEFANSYDDRQTLLDEAKRNAEFQRDYSYKRRQSEYLDDNRDKRSSEDTLRKDSDGVLVDDSDTMLTAKALGNDALDIVDWFTSSVGLDIDYRFKAEKDGRVYSMENKDFSDERTINELVYDYHNAKEDPNASHLVYTLRKFDGFNDDGSEKYIYKNGVAKASGFERYKDQMISGGYELLHEKRFAGAEEWEKAFNANKAVLGERVIDFGTNQDEASGIRFGAGKTELLYKDFLGVEGNQSEEQLVYNKQRSRENGEEYRIARSKGDANIFRSFLAGGATLAVDMGDLLLDVVTPGNNTLLDFDQSEIDEFVGYDRQATTSAIVESVAAWKRGDYFSAVTGDLVTKAEFFTESLPMSVTMGMGMPLKSVKVSKRLLEANKNLIKAEQKLNAASIGTYPKLQGAYNKAKKLRDAELAALKKSGSKVSQLKDIEKLTELPLRYRAINYVAKRLGFLGVVAATTNKILEERVDNGDTDISFMDVMAVGASQYVLLGLDKLAFDKIVGSNRIKESLRNGFKVADEAGKKSILAGITKKVGGLTVAAGAEGVQEYVQTWGEILGANLGINDKGVVDILSDGKHQDEALGGALAGAGAGIVMKGTGDSLQLGAKAVSSVVKGASVLPNRQKLSPKVTDVNSLANARATDILNAVQSHVDPDSEFTLAGGEDIITVLDKAEEGFSKIATDKGISDEKHSKTIDKLRASVVLKLMKDVERDPSKAKESAIKLNKILTSDKKPVSMDSVLFDDIMDSVIEEQRKAEAELSSINDLTEEGINIEEGNTSDTENKNILKGRLGAIIKETENRIAMAKQYNNPHDKLNGLLKTLKEYNSSEEIVSSGKTIDNVESEVDSIGYVFKNGKIGLPSINAYRESLSNSIVSNKKKGFVTLKGFKGFVDSRIKTKQTMSKSLATTLQAENEEIRDVINLTVDSLEGLGKDSEIKSLQSMERQLLNRNKTLSKVSGVPVKDSTTTETDPVVETETETPPSPSEEFTVISNDETERVKAPKKHKMSTTFIGFAPKGLEDKSSTEHYRKFYGDNANTGKYKKGDTVFASFAGAKGIKTKKKEIDEAVNQTTTMVFKALSSGAKVLTDSIELTNKSKYNYGEKQFLSVVDKFNNDNKGKLEIRYKDEGDGVGSWTLHKVKEAPTKHTKPKPVTYSNGENSTEYKGDEIVIDYKNSSNKVDKKNKKETLGGTAPIKEGYKSRQEVLEMFDELTAEQIFKAFKEHGLTLILDKYLASGNYKKFSFKKNYSLDEPIESQKMNILSGLVDNSVQDFDSTSEIFPDSWSKENDPETFELLRQLSEVSDRLMQASFQSRATNAEEFVAHQNRVLEDLKKSSDILTKIQELNQDIEFLTPLNDGEIEVKTSNAGIAYVGGFLDKFDFLSNVVTLELGYRGLTHVKEMPKEVTDITTKISDSLGSKKFDEETLIELEKEVAKVYAKYGLDINNKLFIKKDSSENRQKLYEYIDSSLRNPKPVEPTIRLKGMYNLNMFNLDSVTYSNEAKLETKEYIDKYIEVFKQHLRSLDDDDILSYDIHDLTGYDVKVADEFDSKHGEELLPNIAKEENKSLSTANQDMYTSISVTNNKLIAEHLDTFMREELIPETKAKTETTTDVESEVETKTETTTDVESEVETKTESDGTDTKRKGSEVITDPKLEKEIKKSEDRLKQLEELQERVNNTDNGTFSEEDIKIVKTIQKSLSMALSTTKTQIKAHQKEQRALVKLNKKPDLNIFKETFKKIDEKISQLASLLTSLISKRKTLRDTLAHINAYLNAGGVNNRKKAKFNTIIDGIKASIEADIKWKEKLENDTKKEFTKNKENMDKEAVKVKELFKELKADISNGDLRTDLRNGLVYFMLEGERKINELSDKYKTLNVAIERRSKKLQRVDKRISRSVDKIEKHKKIISKQLNNIDSMQVQLLRTNLPEKGRKKIEENMAKAIEDVKNRQVEMKKLIEFIETQKRLSSKSLYTKWRESVNNVISSIRKKLTSVEKSKLILESEVKTIKRLMVKLDGDEELNSEDLKDVEGLIDTRGVSIPSNGEKIINNEKIDKNVRDSLKPTNSLLSRLKGIITNYPNKYIKSNLRKYYKKGTISKDLANALPRLHEASKKISIGVFETTKGGKTVAFKDGKIVNTVGKTLLNALELFSTQTDAGIEVLPEVVESVKVGVLGSLATMDDIRINILNTDDKDLTKATGLSGQDLQEYKQLIFSGYVPDAVLVQETSSTVIEMFGVSFDNTTDISSNEILKASLQAAVLGNLKRIPNMTETVKFKGKNYTKLNKDEFNRVFGDYDTFRKDYREFSYLTEERRRGKPSATVPKEPKAMINQIFDVPDDRKDFIKKSQSKANKFYSKLDEIAEIYYSGDEGKMSILKAFGYKDIDPDTMHVDDIRKTMSVNLKIEREAELLFKYNEEFKTPEGESIPFYTSYNVASPTRTTIVDDLNIQESKIHREFVSLEGYKSKLSEEKRKDVNNIDVRNLSNNEMFEIALHQAFDLDPDKKGKHQVFKDIREIVDIYNPDGIVIKDTENYGNLKKFIESDKLDFSLLTDEGVVDGGMHGVKAAISLRDYHQHKINPENSGKPFESTLTVEADAITSGIILQMLQLGTDTALEIASKGGVYTEEMKAKWSAYTKHVLAIKHGVKEDEIEFSSASLIEAGKYHLKDMEAKKLTINGYEFNEPFLDIYTFIGQSVVDKYTKLKEKATKDKKDPILLRLLNSIGDIDLQAIRKMSKDPTMTYNYGSLMSTIKTNLAYNHIVPLLKEDRELLEMLIVKTARGDKSNKNVKDFQLIKKFYDNPKNFKVYDKEKGQISIPTREQLNNMSLDEKMRSLVINDKDLFFTVKAYSDTILGDFFSEAFEDTFNELGKVRSGMKATDVLVANTFKKRFDKRVQEFKQNNGGKLSREDFNTILKEMHESGDGHSINIGGTNQPLYSLEAVLSEDNPNDLDIGLKVTGNQKGSYVTVKEKEFTNNNGAAPTISIHNIDAEVIQNAIDNDSFSNIYDAIIFGAEHNSVKTVSDRYQENTITVSSDKSIFNSYANKLLQDLSKLSYEEALEVMVESFNPIKRRKPFINIESKGEVDVSRIDINWDTYNPVISKSKSKGTVSIVATEDFKTIKVNAVVGKYSSRAYTASMDPDTGLYTVSVSASRRTTKVGSSTLRSVTTILKDVAIDTNDIFNSIESAFVNTVKTNPSSVVSSQEYVPNITSIKDQRNEFEINKDNTMTGFLGNSITNISNTYSEAEKISNEKLDLNKNHEYLYVNHLGLTGTVPKKVKVPEPNAKPLTISKNDEFNALIVEASGVINRDIMGYLHNKYKDTTSKDIAILLKKFDVTSLDLLPKDPAVREDVLRLLDSIRSSVESPSDVDPDIKKFYYDLKAVFDSEVFDRINKEVEQKNIEIIDELMNEYIKDSERGC